MHWSRSKSATESRLSSMVGQFLSGIFNAFSIYFQNNNRHMYYPAAHTQLYAFLSHVSLYTNKTILFKNAAIDSNCRVISMQCDG